MTQATTGLTPGSDRHPSSPRTRRGDAASGRPRPHGVATRTITTMAAAGGWCAYASFVVWQGVAGSPLIWQDSYAYVSVSHSPMSSRAFWAGPRPPLIPLVMKFVASAQEFTAVQSIVAVASWGALAFTVGSLVPVGWRRVVATWAILAFATSTPIILWNRSVLSESLSLSLVALLLAAGIRLGARVTPLRIGTFVAVAAACAAAPRRTDLHGGPGRCSRRHLRARSACPRHAGGPEALGTRRVPPGRRRRGHARRGGKRAKRTEP